MIQLPALVFAIITLCPTLPAARAIEVAEPIAAVATTLEEAALLLVTNYAESTFRREVEDCRVLGDGGKAASGFQLHKWTRAGHSQAEVCADPVLAASLALRMLNRGSIVRSKFALYTGGRTDSGEVSRRVRLYRRVLAVLERAEVAEGGGE